MLTYFTVPSVTTTLSEASGWFNPLWAEFSWVAYIMIGVGVFVLLIKVIADKFMNHH